MANLTVLECRAEVQAFAVLMEQKLRENDHKGGWQRDTRQDLMLRLWDEAGELSRCVMPAHEGGTLRVAGEAADVGNFAMMVADVCSVLPELPNVPQAEADRATGAAFRRLVERGEPFRVCGGFIIDGPTPLICIDDGAFCATLPEAVFKALGPLGTCAPVDGLPSAT